MGASFVSTITPLTMYRLHVRQDFIHLSSYPRLLAQVNNLGPILCRPSKSDCWRNQCLRSRSFPSMHKVKDNGSLREVSNRARVWVLIFFLIRSVSCSFGSFVSNEKPLMSHVTHGASLVTKRGIHNWPNPFWKPVSLNQHVNRVMCLASGRPVHARLPKYPEGLAPSFSLQSL